MRAGRSRSVRLRHGLLVVDVFSRMVWVRVLQTPQGAGVNGAYEGLKKNEDVIGVATALDDAWLASCYGPLTPA